MEGKMIKFHRILAALGVLSIVSMPVFVRTSQFAQDASGIAKEKKTAPTGQVHQSDGERKFAQNCARCHNSPQGFSPRISGTIIRHMRVRASLSKKDEQDILLFLNP
jgi:hypothetical protein